MYQGGYAGMLLRFNPTDLAESAGELPPKIAKDFLGIAKLGAKDLFNGLKSPLSPGHKLRFSLSLFCVNAIQPPSRMAGRVKLPFTKTTNSFHPRAHFCPGEKLKDLELEYAAEP